MKVRYYADSLGFFALPGMPPSIDPEIQLNLVHVTAASPLHTTMVDLERSLDHFDSYMIERNIGKGSYVLTGKDLPGDETGTDIILGLQNVPDDVDPARLYTRGIRIAGIAYQGRNHFGSGFLDPMHGLTEDGKTLLGKFTQCGMILDLSHAGHHTARNALETIDVWKLPLPVMASHGGCYAVYGNPRNLPDDVLRGIADRGGVVGIYNLTFGLHEDRNDLEPFIWHLRHAMNVCGEDAVTIGSDGAYHRYSEVELKIHFSQLKQQLDLDNRLGARHPADIPELNRPDRMAHLAERLASFAFSATEVEKVVGLNFLKFLKRSLR